METKVTELDYIQTLSHLDEVHDGNYYGTHAFKCNELTPLQELLSWEEARLFFIEKEGLSDGHWVIIRPNPEIKSDNCSLWYSLRYGSSNAFTNELTSLTLSIHGDRNINRYTGIEFADGFDDRNGFDEIINMLDSVKLVYNVYDVIKDSDESI